RLERSPGHHLLRGLQRAGHARRRQPGEGRRLVRQRMGLCLPDRGPRRAPRGQALMYSVVLLRHGDSDWNRGNRFTGWRDVHLSDKGRAEARAAGQLLKAEGYTFDYSFTSVLTRAIRTLWITLDEMGLLWIPVERSWRLNERHYGALQGLDKAET